MSVFSEIVEISIAVVQTLCFIRCIIPRIASEREKCSVAVPLDGRCGTGIMQRHFDVNIQPIDIPEQSSFLVWGNRYPRSLGEFQLTRGSFGGAFSGIGSFLIGAIHESGEDRIDEQNAKSEQFRPKLYFVAPVLLSLAGYLIAVWGWWNLYWRNPCGWKEFRSGLALIGGFWISVIGGFLFVSRIF